MSAGCAVAPAENAPGCRSRRSGSSACGTSRSPTSSASYGPRRCSPGSSSRALYLQLVLGYSPLEVGLAFLPGNLVTMARLVMRFGIRVPLAAALAWRRSGSALRAGPGRRQLWRRRASEHVLGLGAGIAFNPVLLAAMGDVKPSDVARASDVAAFLIGALRGRGRVHRRRLPPAEGHAGARARGSGRSAGRRRGRQWSAAAMSSRPSKGLRR
jgi:hypothetical protein